MNKAIIVGFGLFAFGNSAFAGDSDFRKENIRGARQGTVVANGKELRALPLLEIVLSNRSNEEVANDLAFSVRSDSSDPIEGSVAATRGGIDRILDQNGRYTIGNTNWGISVRNGGTYASFRNYVYTEENRGLKERARPSDQAIDGLARAFIRSKLAKFLPMGPQESFELWATEFEHEVGGSDGGGAEDDRIVSSRAIFVRTIGGVPVVGSGSKIEVTIANDGAIVGFSYDWPHLEPAGEDQAIAEPGAVLDRVAALVPESGSDLSIHQHECGYFDPGDAYRDSAARVQAACFTRIQKERRQKVNGVEEIIRSGHTFVTPIGQTVEYDEELEKSHPALAKVSDFTGSKIALGTPNAKVKEALIKFLRGTQ